MGNMSYCRFHNTAMALQDCFDNWWDPMDPEEMEAKKKIIKLAKLILELEE